ncbi:hypothetical protein PC121_g9330 [Phytophthora cactorum]|nr:hypothetical protein PC120_g7034 [Phytophthora cactorum]KAG3071139.1 hypothetical protein PC121_g9330 [Phytophthora cactorum]KAG4057912.1 hypothetical protein PC123_g7098 [Phytophthora cactorum]
MTALFGQLETVRILLNRGASIDLPDSYGNTPLMLAADSKHVQVVELLLNSGAAVDATSQSGENALRLAAYSGNCECVRLLLDSGADVNKAGRNNCSPLQNSILGGHIEVAKLLLSRGARIDAADGDGDTVLHEAVLHGQLDVVRLLLEDGADVNAVNGMGWTPLTVASQRGHTDIAALLVEKGAMVEVRTSDERTALVFAAEEGSLEVVRLLLDKGADINVLDVGNQTPLMKAAYRGHEEIVRLLLDNNADAEIVSISGRSAAEMARINGRYEVWRILQEHELDTNKADRSSSTIVTRQSKPDWFIPSREVRKDREPFSSGSFGKVYRGWWLSTRVVVKTVTVATEKESRTFHREARIWQKARHPNIVPFFGACDEGSTCFFVCEEAKNGKLLDYLYHAREEGRSLVWRKLLDAALGLHFLHERHIVHTDLKCNQILVSKDGVAMLTDFGLSFLTTEQSEDDKTVGAIRWKAPEVIRKGNPVAPNALSDVYSFGMCVVEAVTGDVPWGQHVPDPVVKFHVTRKKFIPRPKAFNSDAEWELVEKMCAFEPSERIKLSDAIEKIRGFAEEERFQERLRQMQQERPEDVEFAVPELPIRSKTSTMGAVRALTKMKSLGRSIRMRKGEGNLMAAA